MENGEEEYSLNVLVRQWEIYQRGKSEVSQGHISKDSLRRDLNH